MTATQTDQITSIIPLQIRGRPHMTGPLCMLLDYFSTLKHFLPLQNPAKLNTE
jgi:hypothetical protein